MCVAGRKVWVEPRRFRARENRIGMQLGKNYNQLYERCFLGGDSNAS